MKLADVLNIIFYTVTILGVCLGIYITILIIIHTVKLWKYYNASLEFSKSGEHGVTSGDITSNKRLKDFVLATNLYETTVFYKVNDKKYQFVELSVGKPCAVDSIVDLEYDINSPEKAKIINGTDSSKYKRAFDRNILAASLLVSVVIIFPMAVDGIIGWIDFIIRFCYGLLFGNPNLI